MSIEGIKGTGIAYQGSNSTEAKRVQTQPRKEAADTTRATEASTVKISEAPVQTNRGTTNNKFSSEDGKPVVQMTKTPDEMKDALAAINKRNPDSIVQFGIHEATHRMTIKILDKETKEVIKEFPAEETLDLLAKAWELAGIMVDEKG